MKLLDIKNEAVLFKGVYEDGSGIYVKLNEQVFLFREDPDDGYRSYMIDEGEVDEPVSATFSFAKQPILMFARYADSGSFTGLELYATESSEEPLAQFGTNTSDDYYPCAINYVDVAKINEVYFE